MRTKRRKQCRLCGQPSELQVSHVVPRFVMGHQKKTSATGFLRSNAAINRRVQDGIKEEMLCRGCEAMFSKWETQFSGTVYYPWCDRTALKIEYGPWMLKFAVSVSWRALTWYMDDTSQDESYSRQALELIEDALTIWKRFLLGEIPNPREYEQHLLLLDEMNDASHIHEMPPNFNRYLTRGTQISLAHCKGYPQFMFTKMGRIMLLGFLGIENHWQWDGTKLHVKHGDVGGNRDIKLPAPFFDYLLDQARTIQSEYSKMSKKQQETVGDSFSANMDRFGRSDYFSAMKRDVELFGVEKVFDKNGDTEAGVENSAR